MDERQDFTRGNIFQKLIRFMLPILGALVLQSMYSAVDLLIVGWFGTPDGISGVTVGSSIMHLLTFTVSSLTTGVTVIMSHDIGRGQKERLGGLIGGAVFFFFWVSLAMTVLLTVFARPIAIAMRTPAESLESTVTYIRVCGVGSVFIVFYNVISSVLRGLGDSRTPLLFVVIACCVNIAGDLLLVAVFKMNVMGAAIATVLAQAVSVVLSVAIIRKNGLGFAFGKRDIRRTFEIRRFLRVGAPLSLQDFLTNLSFLALCAFINGIGLDASSGYGIAQKVQSFIMLIPSAIMQSMAAFVSQNVGAKQESRARKGMYCGMAFGVFLGIFIALFVYFKGDLLARIFSDDPVYIRRAFEFLRGFALDTVLTSVLFSFMGYFNGHSKSVFVMIQGLSQSFLIRLPISYIMSVQEDASLFGVGLAAPAATAFGILLCGLYDIRLRRKQTIN